jgi:putative hemolysin
MTIATILDDLLPEIGLDKTSPNIADGSFEMDQILALMNAAGEDISRRAEWSKLYATQTVAGSLSTVALAGDFQRMASTGAVRVNTAAYSPIRVVVAPETWDFLSTAASSQTYCHIRGGNLLFSPTLDANGALVTYLSTYWVGGTATKITANTDTLQFPEHLMTRAVVWRWKRQMGLPYDDQIAEFEADLAQAIKSDRGA